MAPAGIHIWQILFDLNLERLRVDGLQGRVINSLRCGERWGNAGRNASVTGRSLKGTARWHVRCFAPDPNEIDHLFNALSQGRVECHTLALPIGSGKAEQMNGAVMGFNIEVN